MWLGYFMLEMYLNISSSCGFSPFLLAANSGLDKETRYTGLIQCLFEGGVYSRVAFIQRNTVLSNPQTFHLSRFDCETPGTRCLPGITSNCHTLS